MLKMPTAAKSKPRPELPTLSFERPADWLAWLAAHHADTPGLWVKLGKQGAPTITITYAEAVEGALCYGWIDGQKKAFDAVAWLQKFTPRGPQSLWSQINVGKAEALIAGGQIQPAGLAAVEAAKKNGRWAAAYPSARHATMPPDFQAELDRHPEAQAFFDTLNSTNRYAILFRLTTAKKAETRARRLQQFIQMLIRNEKIYP